VYKLKSFDHIRAKSCKSVKSAYKTYTLFPTNNNNNNNNNNFIAMEFVYNSNLSTKLNNRGRYVSLKHDKYKWWYKIVMSWNKIFMCFKFNSTS